MLDVRCWTFNRAPLKLTVALFLTVGLLATPSMAQQNDAPELTAKASAAIDKGLKHLLETHRAAGRPATMAKERLQLPRWDSWHSCHGQNSRVPDRMAMR